MAMNAIAIAIGATRLPFLPSALPNLAAWFRFGMGITSSLGAVSQWNDQTNNARHLKQATGAAQPALQGDNSILFDGTSDYLQCDPFTLNQPFTIYLRAQQVTWTSSDKIFDGNVANSTRLFQNTASPTISISAASAGPSDSNLAVGAYGSVAAVFNGASSVLQVNNNAAATGDVGATNAAGFTLGANAAGANNGNIQVKEVVIYSAAHDQATRNLLISYLGTL